MKTSREYISWSQFSLFYSSKRAFHKKYVLNEDDYGNRRFDKGKELGEYLEDYTRPHYVDDPLLEAVGEIVPKLSIMEHKIETKINDTNLLMYLDSSDGVGDIFYEYKTGKEPWDEVRVIKHDQLLFYACGIYLKYKTIPKCKLFWIETEDVEQENGDIKIRYTGLVEQFEREFTAEEIVNMLHRIQMFIVELEAFKFDEVEISDNTINRYIKLTKLKKYVDDEIELIKLEVQNILDVEQADNAVSEKGRFSISKRKNWNYSKELITKKKKYDDEIKKQQAKEQKDGTATISYTESLRFTLLK